MCKNLFYRFLHFKKFNLNQLSKNKIEPTKPIEPLTISLAFVSFYCSPEVNIRLCSVNMFAICALFSISRYLSSSPGIQFGSTT